MTTTAGEFFQRNETRERRGRTMNSQYRTLPPDNLRKVLADCTSFGESEYDEAIETFSILACGRRLGIRSWRATRTAAADRPCAGACRRQTPHHRLRRSPG